MNVPATVVDRATSAPARPGGEATSPAPASATPASSMETATPDVQLIDVTKRFGAVVAVDRMNLEIPSGSFTSLLGPSGCGKTTTLRMIAGFEQPNAGEILLAGRPIAGVPPYRRNVNTVFQHYALFPHMDVNQNVGYGLRQKHASKADEVARVGQALELVRLGGYGKRRTWELSGGQQQRVALARALINRPAVLLLDEPLGALDRKLRHEMQIELKAIQHEVGITFIYVTHDQEEALTMSDMIVVMRDGLIQQLGSPEMLYRRPANRFVAGFIGSSNFIPGTAREVSDGDRVLVGLAAGVTLAGRLTEGDRPVVDSNITLALRPESVRLGPPRAEGVAARPGWTSVRGRVRSHTYLGDQHEYRVDVPGIGELIARSQAFDVDGGGRAFRPAEDVEVSWHETSALVLTS